MRNEGKSQKLCTLAAKINCGRYQKKDRRTEASISIGERVAGRGWRQGFSGGRLTFSTRGLKYGFQGTLYANRVQKKSRLHGCEPEEGFLNLCQF